MFTWYRPKRIKGNYKYANMEVGDCYVMENFTNKQMMQVYRILSKKGWKILVLDCINGYVIKREA